MSLEGALVGAEDHKFENELKQNCGYGVGKK